MQTEIDHIEWQTKLHPSTNMADAGCRLHDLEVYHSRPSWLKSVLESIGAENLIKIRALPKNRTPYLVAYINTPNGTKELRSAQPGQK